MTNYIADLNSTVMCFRESAERAAESCRTGATYVDGVMTWNSNGNVPPVECVALAAHLGMPVDIAKCNAARTAQQEAFFASYRKRNRKGPSAEARAEARAAHGAGVKLVDVITGRTWTT